MNTIPSLRNASSAGQAFWQKLVDICARHAWDPRAIAAVMAVETGYTFAPDAGRDSWSPTRTATGLIQFIESTARSLGVSRTKVAPDERLQSVGNGKAWATWTLMKMSALDQLDLVEKYYERAFRVVKPTRPVDYYLATWGGSVGQPMDNVLASEGSKAYEANKGLDRDSNGRITVADLDSVVMGAYPNWEPTAPNGVDFPKRSPAPTGSQQQSAAGRISYSQAWQSWESGSSHLASPGADLKRLEYGHIGPLVALLQACLRRTRPSFPSAGERGLRVDGSFGMETTRCVRHYQKTHGLEVDGIVANQTWTSIILGLECDLSADI